jgi:hypothetical protein
MGFRWDSTFNSDLDQRKKYGDIHKPTIILELNGNMANYMIFECLDQPCCGDYRDLM